jgi:hypothetical protein
MGCQKYSLEPVHNLYYTLLQMQLFCASVTHTNRIKFLKISGGYQLSLVIRTTDSRCGSGESPAKAGVQFLDLQGISLET